MLERTRALPADWELMRIGDATLRGKQRNPRRDPMQRFHYIDVSSVSNESFKIVGATELKGSEAPSRARKEVHAGDVLFATVRPTLRRVALVPPQFDHQIASTGFIVLRADRNKIDPHYLYAYLLTDAFAKRMGELERGASYPAVRDSDVLNEVIPVPSLEEQQKISSILGVVQRAIAQQDRLLALTTELKGVLLHRLFTRGLRGESHRETEIGPLPASWQVVELINSVEQIDYGISAPIPKSAPDHGVKIVSTADITKDGRLLYDQIRRIKAPEKTVRRLTLQSGDVLFNWRNSAELIGKSAVFSEQDEPHVFASFILRIKCGEKRSHNFFLAHLMNHFRQTGVFVRLARRAVNQANYNRNEISVLKIPLPSYEEQREIASVIGIVDAKLHQHRHRRSRLEELFRTLLHQLMTARIRVHKIDLKELAAAVAA